jgi:glycosyltransferase involved in cell wall biosynthesis
LRKLKVLQLVPELNSGGVELGTLEVGKYLSEQGHKSIVVSSGGRMVEQLICEGSRHIQMPIHRKNPFSLLEVFILRRLFLLEKPDIVHARSRIPAWLCFLALKLVKGELRPRLVTTVHGFNTVNYYSKIMTAGEKVICVSNSIKDYVLKNYPNVEEGKLVVIHRGIEHEEYPHGYTPSSEWLRKWNDDFPEAKHKKLILLPGRITRLKGHETFIKLIAKLPADFQGIIAGDTHPKKLSYEKELHHLLIKSGLKERITFIGKRDDLKELYAVSLVTLSLSEKPESFGRTVLEALAIGCPVIGYNEGGVGEILEECFPFGLVNRGGVERLKQKILELNEGGTKPERVSKFHLSGMLQQTENLYMSLDNRTNHHY